MSSSAIRIIEATDQNALRITELTRYAYETKTHQGRPLYTPDQLDRIANPHNPDNVNLNLARLASQDELPLLRQFYGHFLNPHDTNEELDGYLKSAVWNGDDEEPFSDGVDNPAEYYSEANSVMGVHTLAVSNEVVSLTGMLLFRRMARDYPNSVIKTAIDEDDKELQEYVKRVWHMEDTMRLGNVAVGNLPESEWPLHRLFVARTDSRGKIIRSEAA